MIISIVKLKKHSQRARYTILLVLAAILPLLITTSALALSGQLNINSATVEELQKLPFIGETKARSIIDYRSKNGPYDTLEDLLKSKAIGQSTFEAIKPYISLSGSSTLTDGIKSPDQPTLPTTENFNITSYTVRRHIKTRPGDIRILPDKEYFDTLISLIQDARQRIDLIMFVFKTTKSPKNRPTHIIRELIKARKRGVHVQVLLEKSGYDENLNKENKKVARLLKKNKITVKFDSPDTTTHTKLVVIDQQYSFVGSHNFTHSALAYNHEFSLLIDSEQLAAELLYYMENLDN